jgi:hypothetical protein
MDIAYWLLVVICIALAWHKTKRRTLQVLLVLLIAVSSWFVWFDVVASKVPAKWQYLHLEARVAWAYRQAEKIGLVQHIPTPQELQDGVVHDFTNLLKTDENGDQHVDENIKKKYGNVQVPKFMEKDFNAMKGKVQTQQAENSSLKQVIQDN